MLKKRAIHFTPTLPGSITDAIEGLIFGRFYKLAMTFEDVFWDNDTDLFVSVAEPGRYGSGSHASFFNLNRSHRVSALVMTAGADFANSLETDGPAQATTVAMQRLRTIYGSGIPDPVQVVANQWATSPYTGGSYTHFGVGTTHDDMAAFNNIIEGRLTFAGEHTAARHFATVHGGYLSGLAAATRLCTQT